MAATPETVKVRLPLALSTSVADISLPERTTLPPSLMPTLLQLDFSRVFEHTDGYDFVERRKRVAKIRVDDRERATQAATLDL